MSGLDRVRWTLAALALGAGLLAVPGVLPAAPGAALPDAALPNALPRDGAAPVAAAGRGAEPPEAAAPGVAGRGPVVTAADRSAGVLGPDVPRSGTGTRAAVPGSAPAPGTGLVRSVRVEVEGGLPIDGPTFAGFVMDTLDDPRGWGLGGTTTFARTDGPAEIVVVLASPDLSARLCRPLVTHGRLSCRTGDRAVLTHYRWVLAHPDYGDDRTGYRQYVVSHEMGHLLGHGHLACPGPGAAAPVMLQQTLGLDGCAPNPWPYP